jgi:hypothetical protein
VNKIKFRKSVICRILVCTIYKVFLEYVNLYLTSEWGQFYVGHPVFVRNIRCVTEKSLILNLGLECTIGKAQETSSIWQ